MFWVQRAPSKPAVAQIGIIAVQPGRRPNRYPKFTPFRRIARERVAHLDMESMSPSTCQGR